MEITVTKIILPNDQSCNSKYGTINVLGQSIFFCTKTHTYDPPPRLYRHPLHGSSSHRSPSRLLHHNVMQGWASETQMIFRALSQLAFPACDNTASPGLHHSPFHLSTHSSIILQYRASHWQQMIFRAQSARVHRLR